MNQTPEPAVSAQLEGRWTFDDLPAGLAEGVPDRSGNGHALIGAGSPAPVEAPFGAGVALDGVTSRFGTTEPVLNTSASYSVAAWVRLDSATTGGAVKPPTGNFAWTALSHSGASHSPFYLGLRVFQEEQPDGSTASVPRWCFTASPVDGSMTGAVEWLHARSAQVVDESLLDQWVLLVGVLNVEEATSTLYVPGAEDTATVQLFDHWPHWKADGGLQLGFGRYLDDVADQWPGSIGTVRAYSGVLSADDARRLYEADTRSGA